MIFAKDIEYLQGALVKSEVLELIYNNNTISECCARMNVAPSALAYVMDNDKEFEMAIYKAQAWNCEMGVEKLANIHEDIDNPLTARVISDNLKWLASKRAKLRYGDKVDIAVTHTIDLKGAIAEAKQRSLTFIDGKCIEYNDTGTVNKTVDAVDLETLDVFA